MRAWLIYFIFAAMVLTAIIAFIWSGVINSDLFNVPVGR